VVADQTREAGKLTSQRGSEILRTSEFEILSGSSNSMQPTDRVEWPRSSASPSPSSPRFRTLKLSEANLKSRGHDQNHVRPKTWSIGSATSVRSRVE
jgi:hypothetical protein